MIAPSVEKDGLAKYTDFLIDELEKETDIEILGIEGTLSLPEILNLARKASEYDVVHVQYTPEFWGNIFGYFWGSYFPLFAKICDAKIVITAHEYDFSHRNKWIKRIQEEKMKRTFLSCDCVIVHNQKGKDFVQDLSSAIKIEIIPHGIPDVEPEEVSEDLDIDGKVALVFGFIRRDKDYEAVVDAVSELEEYKLLIAGSPRTEEDEEYYQELKQYIQEQNAEEKVIHYGYVPDEEIPKVFNTADVSILPYESSDGSGVLALSIAYNVPILMSDISLAHEMGLKSYSNSHELLDKLESESYAKWRKVKEGRSWRSVARQTVEHYKKVINIA